MNELVSIIIPAYNSENYINECLDETIHQTYNNIEIIIINDGSTDRTGDICQKYVDLDARIRYFTQENKGVSASRNLGLSQAHGKYVVFFDADDFPEIDLIEKYMRAINDWNNKTVALVLCGMSDDNLFNLRVGNISRLLEIKHGYIEGENYILGRHSASTLSWLKLFNFVTNKIYDLSIIRAREIKFDENVRIGEDLAFNLDYLDSVEGQLGIINSIGYHYVKRSASSLSISCYESGLDDTKKIYKRFIEWEKAQKNVTEDDILVIKSIYITDWTSRLTSLWDENKKTKKRYKVRHMVNGEINSVDFQTMLKEIHKAKKISGLRYHSLRLGSLYCYCFLRAIYQALKG